MAKINNKNMEAKDLLILIKNNLESNPEIELISPIMYDPIKMEQKISLAIIEKNDKGSYKRFTITIDDHLIK